MILNVKQYNTGNLWPTPERPLLLRVTGQAPSLKNDRDFVPTERGLVTRPNASVEKFIKSLRAAMDRQLPEGWRPIPMPTEVKLLMIVGAHAVSTIPDADADNMGQTIQEGLAFPGNIIKIPEGKESSRFLIVNDRQVQCPIPFRVPFRVKENIYHDILVWVTDGKIISFIDEMTKIGKVIEELYGGQN